MIWEEIKLFFNVEFCVYMVWLFNFSGLEEEFVLVLCVIMYGMVIWNMKIRLLFFFIIKKLEIKVVIVKLKEFLKCYNYFCIICFDEVLVEFSFW